MKRKSLKIEELSVNSFVTGLNKVTGGERFLEAKDNTQWRDCTYVNCTSQDTF